MVEYDATHVTGRLTTQEIAEAIRHKKYGVDMRETLALSICLIGMKLFRSCKTLLKI